MPSAPCDAATVRHAPWSLLVLFALLNTGCATFVGSGEGGAPYLFGAMGLGAAFVGEKRIKANNGGALGWTLRILGIVLFLIG